MLGFNWTSLYNSKVKTTFKNDILCLIPIGNKVLILTITFFNFPHTHKNILWIKKWAENGSSFSENPRKVRKMLIWILFQNKLRCSFQNVSYIVSTLSKEETFFGMKLYLFEIFVNSRGCQLYDTSFIFFHIGQVGNKLVQYMQY